MRPVWQQVGIWLIAFAAAIGLVVSSNAALDSSGSDDTTPVVVDTTTSPVPEESQEATPPASPSPVDPVEDPQDIVLDDAERDYLTALEQLEQLGIEIRAPRDGYNRTTQFGRAWIDVDRNGCDTRNDILRRDLDDTVVDSRCRVLSGVLVEPFTGDTIVFERGEETSALVQIDHVVSLSNAWQTGAQLLSERQRVEFANDPLNLIAVSGRVNQQKGDSDAASWLPPRRDWWCEYVARQVGVKAHYSLWVTSAEYAQMRRVLVTCPNYPALTPAEHGRFRPDQIPLP
jgi:hypothetical protein